MSRTGFNKGVESQVSNSLRQGVDGHGAGVVSRLGRLVRAIRHAFAMESPYGKLKDEERELLRRLAAAIGKRRMCAPAIMFLESVRPLNYVGSQAMVFLRPFLTLVFLQREYDTMGQILERREGISALVEEIEAVAAEGTVGSARES